MSERDFDAEAKRWLDGLEPCCHVCFGQARLSLLLQTVYEAGRTEGRLDEYRRHTNEHVARLYALADEMARHPGASRQCARQIRGVLEGLPAADVREKGEG